jgi:hypothetical protein
MQIFNSKRQYLEQAIEGEWGMGNGEWENKMKG